MSVGKVFFGLRSAAVLEANRGRTDHGAPIEYRLTTSPVAPAGAGGEAAFHLARLVVTHDCAVTLTTRPLIDGKTIDESATRVVELAAPADGQARTSIIEVGLTKLTKLPSGTVVGRHAPRGTWGMLQIDVVQAAAGQVTIEPPELEYSEIRESRKAQP